MTTELVLRTNNPRVVEYMAGVKQQLEAKYKLRKLYLDEIRQTWGQVPGDYSYQRSVDRELWINSGYFGREVIVGISAGWSEQDSLPTGFRYDKKKRMAVPALKTPEGREVRTLWGTMAIGMWIEKAAVIGIATEYHSPMVEGQGYMYWPNLQLIDGWVYQTWGTTHARKETLTRAGEENVDWDEIPVEMYESILNDQKEKNRESV